MEDQENLYKKRKKKKRSTIILETKRLTYDQVNTPKKSQHINIYIEICNLLYKQRGIT